jgi:type IV secretory pathway VirJ component
MKNSLFQICWLLLICCVYPNDTLFARQINPTKNIPVLEFKASGTKDFYVIFLSGNGGVRNLVQSITHFLNLKNVPVIVVNTKKYLWSEKNPEQIGCDLGALIERYDRKWGKRHVVLMGFSMGAEVLPFSINYIDEKYMGDISDMVLIAPWQKATFKISLKDYYKEVNVGLDIYGELLKMKTKKGYIICDDTTYSICHKELDGVIDYDRLAGGHHFRGHSIALSGLLGKRLNLE